MKKQFILSIVSLFSILFFASCESVVDDDVNTPHYQMSGFGMFDSSNKMLIKVMNGSFVEGSTSQITVAEGSDIKNVKVRFFDSDGVEISKPGVDYTTLFDVNNTDVAKMTLEDNQSMQYTISGLLKGATKMRLKVLHGSHYDYTSPEIQIVVN